MEAEDEGRQASWHFNREVVARSDALGQPLDFVLLGDSMAANIRWVLGRGRDMGCERQQATEAAGWRRGARLAASAAADLLCCPPCPVARRTLYPNLWKQYWGDLEAAPLGVGGNTVEELTWRLALGGERFALPPRVAAVWIGHQ